MSHVVCPGRESVIAASRVVASLPGRDFDCQCGVGPMWPSYVAVAQIGHFLLSLRCRYDVTQLGESVTLIGGGGCIDAAMTFPIFYT